MGGKRSGEGGGEGDALQQRVLEALLSLQRSGAGCAGAAAAAPGDSAAAAAAADADADAAAARAPPPPTFQAFCAAIGMGEEGCGQAAQRATHFLRRFCKEAPCNAALAAAGCSGEGDVALAGACAAGGEGGLEAGGQLVCVDLTDPLLSAAQAGLVGRVVIERFRAGDRGRSKCLCVDGAQRFGEGVWRALRDAAGSMHLEKIRILVSAGAAEGSALGLLEAADVRIVHAGEAPGRAGVSCAWEAVVGEGGGAEPLLELQLEVRRRFTGTR